MPTAWPCSTHSLLPAFKSSTTSTRLPTKKSFKESSVTICCGFVLGKWNGDEMKMFFFWFFFVCVCVWTALNGTSRFWLSKICIFLNFYINKHVYIHARLLFHFELMFEFCHLLPIFCHYTSKSDPLVWTGLVRNNNFNLFFHILVATIHVFRLIWYEIGMVKLFSMLTSKEKYELVGFNPRTTCAVE